MGTTEDTADAVDAADARTAVLVREAMDRATAELPALLDLSGPARAQGRRRRARVRVAIGAGVLAVATLGAVTASLLPGGGGQRPVEDVVAAPPASPTAPPQPVHIEPTPGESSMAGLPPAERARQEDFQNRAVGVLQSLLPPAVGTVQRTDLKVNFFQATKDGTAFPVIFSVRPSGEKPQPCQEVRGRVCAKATLPGGIEAHASTIPTGTATETEVSFRYGTCNVRLSVFPHEASNTSAPVTPAQLLDVVGAPAFLDLVRAAEAQPMEEEQRSVPGG
ncbi:hypothetical protein [Streptomyces erythrochromogenes]|uniref:hypothetical protein n=1 Tax=Streptomyces erythrochromogenes TaxID=285574 RepID=UPI003677B911